jgi:hypothetical protein
MTIRGLGVAAVFLMGCAVGGVSSQLAVPRASAQQAASLQSWEMKCVSVSAMSPGGSAKNATEAGMLLGAQRWEPVGGHDAVWCFKRAKL